MRAVDAIMECLKAEGVDAVFGIPGGANLPISDQVCTGCGEDIVWQPEAQQRA